MGLSAFEESSYILFMTAKNASPDGPIDPKTPLGQCRQAQVNVGLPAPLNERIEELVRLANAAGADATRKQVIAALVLAASTDPRMLLKQVIGYRTAHAEDAAVSPAGVDAVLNPRRYARGRRPRSSD
jgi:hypothetical protein